VDTLAEISGHFAAKWLDSGFRNQVDSIGFFPTFGGHIFSNRNYLFKKILSFGFLVSFLSVGM